MIVIKIVPWEAGGAAGTKVGQNEASVTGGAGEGSSAPAGSAGGVTFLTSSPLCIVSRRAVGNTAVPQQQVPGILAPQADAPGVAEIGCTVLAQRMAVGTVAHEVEELLLLTAGPAAPAGQSAVRVTGDAVRSRRAVALPAGWVAFCTNAFLVKVSIWALGEALPIQQHMGRPAGRAVMGALPYTPQTGLVALFTQPRVLQVKMGSALGQALARGDVCPRQLLSLQSFLWLLALGALRGLRTHTSQAREMTGFADPAVGVEALSAAGQAVALTQSLGGAAGSTLRGGRAGAAGTRVVTRFASARGISVVAIRAFRNAFPIIQHRLLSTGETSGTTGATTLTGLITSTAGPLFVVKPVATAALTAALPQHVERVTAGQAVLLGGAPAGHTGLVAGCTGVAVLVEAVPTGGHTLAVLHQQGRLAGRALQATGACGALGLAG